jgi:polygalacturonase
MNIVSAPKGALGNRVPRLTTRGKILTAIAASLTLASVAMPASATNWWTTTPTVSIGTTALNVKNFGAMGNGVTDDTAAIQAAINALPATGGTVVVPNGTYMINALKAINLRSHVRLSMWGSAYLKAIPNSASRYWVVKAWNVNNVEIVGGNVIGERSQHLGTTGEWGYGINVSGASNVYVHDIHVSDSWGDGLLVGAIGSGTSAVLSTNVTLNRVTSSNNRRQGLTIAPATQVYVVNSSFNGSNGTAPQSGIDIEPMTQGSTQHVRLENVTVANNAGSGLEIRDYVSDVVLNKFTSQNNKGYGVYTNSPNGLVISNSTLSQNWLFGLDIGGTTNNVQLIGNTINWNGDAWFYNNNVSIFTPGWVPRDVTISSTATNITQSNNLISPLRTK